MRSLLRGVRPEGARLGETLFLLSLAFLMAGCSWGGGEPRAGDNPAGTSASLSSEGIAAPCDPHDTMAARKELVSRSGMDLHRADWPDGFELGEEFTGEGFTIRSVTWDHPQQGDSVFGLYFEPSPRPPRALPLLLNVHGHWGAGLESGEVLFRSELFAAEGWAVLSVASRGSEQGELEPPAFRRHHFDDGLFGRLRERSFGRTPLAWYAEAASRGLDHALEGRFGRGPVDRDRVGMIAASGGVEPAVALAATEPRVGALVLAAFEYAFGSQGGSAACSCGVLSGGHEPKRVASWLRLAGCRVGREIEPRPTLLWDGQPDSVLSGLLAANPGWKRRAVPGVHGFNPAMAAASWRWMEQELRGVDLPVAEEDRARASAQSRWAHVPARLRPTWPPGLPGVGLVERARAPWSALFPPSLRRAREELGLRLDGRDVDPGEGWVGPLSRSELRIERALSTPDGRAWVVLEDPDRPTPRTLASSDPTATFIHVLGRINNHPGGEERLTRWGLELGRPPLGLALHDGLEAARRVGGLPEVDPQKVGFIGIGSSGLAAALAARELGKTTSVRLIDAPLTLWQEGPRSGDEPSPVASPWPATLMVPGPRGARYDPWFVIGMLGDRVRLLRPRGPLGEVWDAASCEAVTGQPLPGRTVSSVEALLRRD